MSFKEVNPVINGYMQKSAMHMQDGIMFVVLAVKAPFHTMYNQMQDYRKHGLSSKYVWGFKKQTLEYLLENRDDLYKDLMDMWTGDWWGDMRTGKHERDKEMMLRLTMVPGLGMVKAGFVMQMMFGRVGCIDVHNMRRFYKISEKDITFTKMAKTNTKLEKINNYVQICKGNRSTEKLWDSWCEQLVDKRCNKGHFQSGWDVSVFHLESLVGKRITA